MDGADHERSGFFRRGPLVRHAAGSVEKMVGQLEVVEETANPLGLPSAGFIGSDVELDHAVLDFLHGSPPVRMGFVARQYHRVGFRRETPAELGAANHHAFDGRFVLVQKDRDRVFPGGFLEVARQIAVEGFADVAREAPLEKVEIFGEHFVVTGFGVDVALEVQFKPRVPFQGKGVDPVQGHVGFGEMGHEVPEGVLFDGFKRVLGHEVVKGGHPDLALGGGQIAADVVGQIAVHVGVGEITGLQRFDDFVLGRERHGGPPGSTAVLSGTRPVDFPRKAPNKSVVFLVQRPGLNGLGPFEQVSIVDGIVVDFVADGRFAAPGDVVGVGQGNRFARRTDLDDGVGGFQPHEIGRQRHEVSEKPPPLGIVARQKGAAFASAGQIDPGVAQKPGGETADQGAQDRGARAREFPQALKGGRPETGGPHGKHGIRQPARQDGEVLKDFRRTKTGERRNEGARHEDRHRQGPNPEGGEPGENAQTLHPRGGSLANDPVLGLVENFLMVIARQQQGHERGAGQGPGRGSRHHHQRISQQEQAQIFPEGGGPKKRFGGIFVDGGFVVAGDEGDLAETAQAGNRGGKDPGQSPQGAFGDFENVRHFLFFAVPARRRRFLFFGAHHRGDVEGAGHVGESFKNVEEMSTGRQGEVGQPAQVGFQDVDQENEGPFFAGLPRLFHRQPRVDHGDVGVEGQLDVGDA